MSNQGDRISRVTKAPEALEDIKNVIESAYREGYEAARANRPLTDGEILAANYPDGAENGAIIAAPDYELVAFARQIEAAYGLKENP